MPIGRPAAIALLVVAAVSFVYVQTVRFEFTNWDDDRYVTENTRLGPLSAAEVASQFSRFELGNYHPLTMLSFALDLRMARRNSGYFHAVAVGLHLLNTALVFFFVRALARSDAIGLGAAAIFGVHPSHVESVAWVSSRKDLLFTAFGLASLLSYLRHARTGRSLPLVAAFALFVLSLLSKGMAVSIVPTLVVVDWAVGRRLRDARLWLEKLPFAVVALVFGIVAVRAQEAAGAIASPPSVGATARLVFAGANLVVYAAQQLVPFGLQPLYPYPAGLPGEYVALCLLLVPIAAVVWRMPLLVQVGALFFVANLASVVQLVPFGMALRADRYTYFAGVGSALALASLIDALRRRSALWLVPATAYVGVLALVAHRQAEYWRSSLTLWDEVIRRTPTVAVAYGNRGAAHFARHEYDLAEQDLRGAIALDAGNPTYHTTLGAIAAKRGDYTTALSRLEYASALRPGDALILSNLAWVLTHTGDYADAVRQATLAIERDPMNALAYGNRGQARLASHDLTGAAADFDRAIRLRPDLADAYYHRAFVWLESGDFARACADIHTGDGLVLMDEEVTAHVAAIRDERCTGVP